MTRIAILTPSLTTGDAVGNDVLGMYEVLSERGHNVRLYAEGWASVDEYKIWPADKVASFLKSQSDLLIYHYSRGWDFGLALLRELPCRTAIKYHNVTPPEFFDKFSPDLARMCMEGRAQLKQIAAVGCDIYMSASAYNERELLDEGVEESRSYVVPPFHHIDRLSAVEADRKILEAYDDDETNILMVGRISPHKGHPALIEAFAAYHLDYNPASRLFIVGKGDPRLEAYSKGLREIAKHLNVEDALVFAGGVSDSELKAYYSLSDVFMITSEHEGFCVPLVEAMSMKVPIVAYGSSAIPGTVDGVGLVWVERDPYLLAESVNAIVKDRRAACALGRMGLRRYEENFTNRKIETEFLKAIGNLL
ncbi:MAG TPA: glycosyltransferase family 4 protein [Pyrinomonadaceae bacterium]|nr:glycosyltransferase family 4 protein [Pyrinomonadaceae bacterium]